MSRPPPLLLLLLLLPPGLLAASWAAWMPASLSALSGSCASIPCRFAYPEELRPGSVQGLWYFGSPYPKNYPPVVARSRAGAVHESFAGRARLTGDPALRDCSLQLGPPLSPELSGRYYFRGDLGGYNQYSFSEHATLQVIGYVQCWLGVVPALRDCSLQLGPPLSPELSGRYYFRGDLGGYNQYSFSEHATLQVIGYVQCWLGVVPALRDCSLQLGPPLSPELSGRYYFRGDLGGYNQYSFSEHATLQVIDEPILELPPELVAGAVAELRCRVPDSCPLARPRLAWAGAEDLPELWAGERREDAATGAPHLVARLRFRPRRQDGGRRLGCQVTLPNSSLAFRANAELDVQYEPQVLEVSGPTEALEGSQVDFGCLAEGRPPPLLTWFRGPQVLREEPGAAALPLHLPQVSPQDSGTYTCVAENRHGRHNRSLELQVAYAPRPPVLNGTLWVVAGDQVSLTCAARSHPAPIVTLARGRRLLATAVYEPQVRLELPAAAPEDGGEYLCRAENQHGASSLAFNVTVEYPPVLLPESRCSPLADGAARCVCAAAALPPPALAFELPSLNLTVAEGHRDFALAAPGGGGGAPTWAGPGEAATAVLTLRGGLEPRLAVLCAARNGHGAARAQLRFHHPAGLVWAKVGPVGAVVAFAVVIALVCYLSQSRRKKASGSPAVTPVTPPGGRDPEPRPPQVRWLRGAVGRWAMGVGEGPGAPPEPAPPPKPARGPPEEPPEYAEIRVK